MAALEWAREPAARWGNLHHLEFPPSGNAFLVSFSEALATDYWSEILIHDTRVIYAGSGPMQTGDQLALLHLAEPHAPAEALMAEIVYANVDFTLGRIARMTRERGFTVQGPEGAPTDPAIDAFFEAITQAPVPFSPDLARETYFDGSNIHFEDRYGRTPAFSFNTHGLVENPELRLKWGGAAEAAQTLEAHLHDRWATQMKSNGFRPILNQIHDLEVQGPAWFRIAVQEQWPGLAKELLGRGLDPRKAGPDGTVPLVAACGLKDGDLFEAMVTKWGNPAKNFKPVDETADSPLTYAVSSGSAARITRLIEMGADPNALGFRPLGLAIQMGDLTVVKALLEGGAKVSGQDLEAAKAQGFLPILKALRETADKH